MPANHNNIMNSGVSKMQFSKSTNYIPVHWCGQFSSKSVACLIEIHKVVSHGVMNITVTFQVHLFFDLVLTKVGLVLVQIIF
jgi:hypothetical protein